MARLNKIEIKRDALISDDGLYRYWLLRLWNPALPLACYFGINPSVADAKIDDPTIRKEIGFSDRLGFGGFLKLNAGAYRATDPRYWRKAADPIGPGNSIESLKSYIAHFLPAKIFVCWGKNGQFAQKEITAIEAAFPNLWCFGRNGDGSPVHPLMLPYSTEPRRYCACHCHREKVSICSCGNGWECDEGQPWKGA